MSFSKHNNLETPNDGTQNWGPSLNENFDLIEKGPTIKSTAGTTIAVNDVVYLDTSGNFQLALADTTVANRYVGFATSAMNNNADGFARILGYESNPDWFFNAADIVYLSAITPGGITSIAPADLVQVGTAMATNEILIRPFGTGSLQDHGSLSGLTDDDHTAYLRTDNFRSSSGLTVSGILDVGTITSVGLTIDTPTVTLTQDTDFILGGGVNGMSIDGTTLSVDGVGKAVGFGTSAPESAIHLNAVDTTTFNAAPTDGQIGDGATLTIRNQENTTDNFSQILFRNRSSSLGISRIVSINTASLSTALAFVTENVNVPAEQMRIIQTGEVGIGATVPLGQLHVDQKSTSGARPVIVLDQADVDEDFFKFIGTSDTSADRALVDAVNFSTIGALKGHLKINIQDDQGTDPITDGDYYIPFYAVPTA